MMVRGLLCLTHVRPLWGWIPFLSLYFALVAQGMLLIQYRKICKLG